MITRNQYLSDPCKAASIPYWKAKSISIPDGMKILHQEEYNDGSLDSLVKKGAYEAANHMLKQMLTDMQEVDDGRFRG